MNNGQTLITIFSVPWQDLQYVVHTISLSVYAYLNMGLVLLVWWAMISCASSTTWSGTGRVSNSPLV